MFSTFLNQTYYQRLHFYTFFTVSHDKIFQPDLVVWSRYRGAFGKSQMEPSYMGPNFFKEIAKMALELLGLVLELLLLLLLLLLHVFNHVLLRGRGAPP